MMMMMIGRGEKVEKKRIGISQEKKRAEIPK